MSNTSSFQPGHARSETSLFHGLSSAEVTRLEEACVEAKSRAHCPYSHFRVGASLLLTSGAVIQGANVENAAYPVGTCAERVAIATAVVQVSPSPALPPSPGPLPDSSNQGAKKGDFRALAVATDISPPASPCGMCRQFIREFCDLEMPVLMYDVAGKVVVMTLEQLLPMSFGPDKLLSAEQVRSGVVREDGYGGKGGV
ncbi:hypothetical protein LTR95_006609 [Oleoguttula sp. CCFEE 5521]